MGRVANQERNLQSINSEKTIVLNRELARENAKVDDIQLAVTSEKRSISQISENVGRKEI
jgi:hypothetical protein